MTPLKFTVNFDEADGEGIVFFGNYFRLAHRALEQYLAQIGFPWEEWFKNQEFGVPLRHVEADYLRPLRPGDTFFAAVKVAEIGESSVTFDYEFQDPSGKSLAKLKTAHVFASRADFRKIPIPASIRSRLQAATGR
jgi:YbgC/YbaW family acyl-CoA thioester hydrolase